MCRIRTLKIYEIISKMSINTMLNESRAWLIINEKIFFRSFIKFKGITILMNLYVSILNFINVTVFPSELNEDH